MTKITDTGGSAFPISTIDNHTEYGMTLRDYFAAKAMQGLISMAHQSSESKDKYTLSGGWVNYKQIVKEAYVLADLMIEQRKKTK